MNEIARVTNKGDATVALDQRDYEAQAPPAGHDEQNMKTAARKAEVHVDRSTALKEL